MQLTTDPPAGFQSRPHYLGGSRQDDAADRVHPHRSTRGARAFGVGTCLHAGFGGSRMDSFVYIGKRQVWGGEQPFGFSPDDRRQHCYVIGKTGTGKSTLLKNLILQDIHAGRGVAVVDPHGDLAQEILDHYPPSRADDLVYFNPGDLEHPIA